ncbi:MAG: dTDP-4-dehydrorhamnose 3,5-epimerase [Verrucomicrobiales bacterium]|nr:dTDP-4-dehydrorhamnose 3,5-epimerase [Verrucomicrobiales bacterium]
MKFIETPLKGAYVIELDPRADERGWFARFFCKQEFEQHGLCNNIVQINNSFSKHKGTLRGMHYQVPPRAEDKIVRCIRGAFYDVIVDLRPDSPTFLQHFGIELNAENRKMLFVPKGFAHGFLTLVDETEALYLVTEFYSPQHERGLRYNDPKLGIKWPFEPVVISQKDRQHPDFDPDFHLK